MSVPTGATGVGHDEPPGGQERDARVAPEASLLSLGRPTSLDDPLAIFAAGMASAGGAWYWESPSRGSSAVGLGSAWSRRPPCAVEAAAAQQEWRRLIQADEVAPGSVLQPAEPSLWAGVAFAGTAAVSEPWSAFPRVIASCPRFEFERLHAGSRLISNVRLGAVGAPASTFRQEAEQLDQLESVARAWTDREHRPAPERLTYDTDDTSRWIDAVELVAGAARTGRVRKVVLARSLVLRARDGIDVVALLDRLRRSNPDCTTYAVAMGFDILVGSTPELLVSQRGGRVESMALAGTRAVGPDPRWMNVPGAELLDSAKDREEHRIVVDSIRDGLSRAQVERVVTGATQTVVRGGLQHLETRLGGWSAPGRSVLDIVAELHPTAAVCGTPRETALQFISEYEEEPRGWYSGAIGRVDGRGDGEFIVALRCALLSGQEARLYAGCGIIGDSDPHRELEEWQLKLSPMISALNGRT